MWRIHRPQPLEVKVFKSRYIYARIDKEEVIMQTALRIQTIVLPGNRLNITAPELPEGNTVEVIIMLPEISTTTPSHSMIELVDTLPPGPRSGKTWQEIEKHLQEERDSWDR